ncbi:uncharacterized protein PHACADRAFT_263868 [Phanerochaete carnosa HHB-10118-sp]|uniref:Uncharacterized protein n=1 Tax=Phanerochaete carnosa (strain HHB-10118-sp) TaxID=650164 RepID=K5VH30_PHACS|nr:uncharacterized protein PHACADRAFT_263868 [Phanerochaete carnosa HHB-10118-sp]EKM50533.1 hypothetical protein PHACADRAFT_263868 [Phanerochaete carnosa HHB-10118-sp]
MASESTLPQKRKAQPQGPGVPPSEDENVTDKTADVHPPKNEYETGRVTCESCGASISFRDEATGGFTVKHWDLHRQQCPSAVQQITVSDPVLYTPESQGEPVVPQPKRRRAKRTEDERIDYLRSDPYVAQFEAYRVLCASCDKWIRLRPNSTYCSIPWDAHRKSCLTKKASKHPNPNGDRSGLFATDPQVRKFDSERVLCKICETWVALGTKDDAQAIQTWLQHRTTCLQNRPTPTSTTVAAANANIPTADSVPPPSRHLMALVSSSSLPTPPLPSTKTASEAPSFASPISVTSFKDLNPSNFAPSQESRRRNAEQRAAQLRSDPLIGEVEPNRVFCTICQKWVQLRQDSSYCAYPWQQHRGKCLKRKQKRAQKEAELAEYRAQMEALRQEELARAREDSMDVESEDGADSGDEAKARRRQEKRRAKQLAEAERLRKIEERRAILRQKEAALNSSDGDEDAEGESDVESETPLARMADLGTPAGRIEFISRSVQYLFRTTYDHADELTIAALVTYLNAAIPPDKHEDFDTTEVTKTTMVLRERGEFSFEGDVLRMP